VIPNSHVGGGGGRGYSAWIVESGNLKVEGCQELGKDLGVELGNQTLKPLEMEKKRGNYTSSEKSHHWGTETEPTGRGKKGFPPAGASRNDNKTQQRRQELF